ncbi:MAG: trimethylamine methyltransferase family protein, partial [Firmicutes bacterium]|nr:trimethylamine methyltransferase family protein [Bacillota bacterium]
MYKEEVLGYSVLCEQDLAAIHEATLKVLHTTGLRVLSARAREIYSGAGCSVDSMTGMVKIPAHVVNDAIEAAPARVLLAARNKNHDIILEGRKVYFKNFA